MLCGSLLMIVCTLWVSDVGIWVFVFCRMGKRKLNESDSDDSDEEVEMNWYTYWKPNASNCWCKRKSWYYKARQEIWKPAWRFMFSQMKLSSQHNNKPNRNLRNKEGKQNWSNTKSIITLGESVIWKNTKIETSCFSKLENNNK